MNTETYSVSMGLIVRAVRVKTSKQHWTLGTNDVIYRLPDPASGHRGQLAGHADDDDVTDTHELNGHHVRLPLVRVLDLEEEKTVAMETKSTCVRIWM